jgi:hypothetical protein
MDTKLRPSVRPVLISDLRPTQITVGLGEVKQRRNHWRQQQGKKAARFLGKHMIPVILGPEGHHYLIDNHHLARALYDEGVKSVLTLVIADLRKLETAAFWFVMDNRGWLHRTTSAVAAALTRICRAPSRICATTRSELLPASSGAQGGSPRRPSRSPNFCGPIFCAGE